MCNAYLPTAAGAATTHSSQDTEYIWFNGLIYNILRDGFHV
jgi:hypothetical protein